MRKTQQSGDNSVNYQAEVINAGLSYRDAKEIATDVFKENIPKFAQIAQEVALERAMNFTEALLGDIPPNSLESLKNPDVQRALFLAQQEFACSGEEHLGKILIDLLRNRMASQQRDIRQLALIESLKTAPKLTESHISALGISLILSRTRMGVKSAPELYEEFRKLLSPLVENISLSDADIAYMEYAGCLSISMGQSTISHILKVAYPGIFSSGFTREQIPAHLTEIIDPLLCPCPRNMEKLQFNAVSNQDAQELCADRGVDLSSDDLSLLLKIGLMEDSEVEAEFTSSHPSLAKLASLWDTTSLKNCSLTTVGVTIGFTNLKCIVGGGIEAELDVWVN